MNKFVWSALGWNPDRDVAEILRQYSRYFIGDAFSGQFRSRACWRWNAIGTVRWHANTGVDATLEQFQNHGARRAAAGAAQLAFPAGALSAPITMRTPASACFMKPRLESQAMRKLRETHDTAGARLFWIAPWICR